MDLAPFDWSIGISDIMGWRECPARMAYGMRRHVELPPHLQLEPGETDEPPEATNWTNAYGSAIHHAIHLVDKQAMAHEDAIQECMKTYGPWLEPQDIDLLREDLLIFERRRPTGVTFVASEQDVKVPLFIADNGQQIFFRFKLDVLQRLISNPAVFLHRDYKSSKWPRTPAEVHKDPQLWAYNWAIHEYWPECVTLLQTYDQLKFGEIPTSKNAQQRASIKRWLIDMVTAIMADTTYKPKQNDFCRYCPLVVTCRETHRATAYWRGQLAVLAPLTKEGRKIKVAFADEGDELERIIRDEMPKMAQTRKHIEHVEKELKTVLRRMPEEERERLGWALQHKTAKHLDADGLRALHELVGDLFYELVSVPMTAIEQHFGRPKKGEEPSAELRAIRNWLLTEDREPIVIPANTSTHKHAI